MELVTVVVVMGVVVAGAVALDRYLNRRREDATAAAQEVERERDTASR